MAGYYDEETGDWIDTGDVGTDPLDDTSGTNTMHDAAIWDPGSQSYTDWQGYPVDSTGQPMPGNPSYVDPTSVGGGGEAGSSFVDSVLSKMTGLTGADLKTFIKNNAGLATGALGLYSAMGGNKTQTGGWQGAIPNLEAVRSQVHYNANHTPGSQGRQYFTPTQFVAAGAAPAAQASADTQAKAIAAATPQEPQQANPYAGKFAMPWAKQGTQPMAAGGLAHGRYLQGSTDGMADKIDTSIDDKQPAKLSHGEFVIPADVVSHLGNGNSDAGAQHLYAMMDKVRQARTGTKKQGKEINPDKFTPGGLASHHNYAAGGAVAFDAGGNVTTSPGTTAPAATPGYGTTASSTLSPWAGNYVADMMGKGQALANQPYQQYTGQLTAGASDLQQQQQAGLTQLAQTGLTPTQYNTSGFDATQANKYMNPYLQSSLDPQLKELQRQAQIANVNDASKLTGQGGFGGGRQAVLMGEQNRNLLDKSQQLIGSGYNTAYNNAMTQFNADQNRGLQTQQAQDASNQASAQFGLNTLNAMGTAGATQREIEQQGLTADKTAFEAERDAPYKMVQYQQGLLQGLPLTTNTTTPNTTGTSSLTTQLSDLQGLYDMLAKLGQTPPK